MHRTVCCELEDWCFEVAFGDRGSDTGLVGSWDPRLSFGVKTLGLVFAGCTWQWRLPSCYLGEDIVCGLGLFRVKIQLMIIMVRLDDGGACALLHFWGASFWRIFFGVKVLPLLLLLLLSVWSFDGSPFYLLFVFSFLLCAFLMSRLILGIMLLQRLDVFWYHLGINICSLSKNMTSTLCCQGGVMGSLDAL
jgi:hypothetical protein